MGRRVEDGELTKLWLTDSDDYWATTPYLYSATVATGEDGKIYITGTEYDKYMMSGSYFGEGTYIDSVHALMAPSSANWQLVPEPTTATLSLLALAGLAARRRRK